MDKRFYNVFDPDEEAVFVRQSGWEACIPGYSYGPAIRDFFLLHMVLDGCGTLYNAAGEFKVERDQGFIILPGEKAWYRADLKTPWTYAWVGYAGERAASLTRLLNTQPDKPVFSLGSFHEEIKQIVLAIHQDSQVVRYSGMSALGGLYRLFALLQHANGNNTLQNAASAQQYCRKAYWFMEENLSRNPRVEEIAAYVGLSRSQLFRIFKTCRGESPQEALMRLRLEKAQQFVIHSDLPLKEIALALGFSRTSNMGQAYRKYYGVTLRAARSTHMQNPAQDA